MRIGIDVRDLSHGLVGGVHTYVTHFVPALIELAQDHEILLYADTKRPFELHAWPRHVQVRLLTWRSPLSKAYQDVLMWRHMAQDQLDLVHFPSNYGFGPPHARTVITLHDEINILPLREIVRGHPKNIVTMAMMTYLHFLTLASLRRADLIITVSSYAGKRIAHFSGFDPEKIVPVPHAPTPDLRRITDCTMLADVRRRYDLTHSFVLADALKNPAVLVKAWRLLPSELRNGRQIVFFSRRPDPLPIVHEAVDAGEARLLVRPPREDLIALYSMTEAFVFPSWIEGFGIPVLEAMVCGAPVIASNRGAIPEVAGDAALLSDVEDIATLSQHIAIVLGSPAQAQMLRERGFARAAQFSWRDTAQRILDCYSKAARIQPLAGKSRILVA